MILFGQGSTPEGNTTRKSKWEEISRRLNAVTNGCGSQKTAAQWEKCFKNIQLRSKRRVREFNRERNTTGGGEIDTEVVPTEEDWGIQMIIGPALQGIPEAGELGFHDIEQSVENDQPSQYSNQSSQVQTGTNDRRQAESPPGSIENASSSQ